MRGRAAVAKRRISGRRDIAPSAFVISQMTPTVSAFRASARGPRLGLGPRDEHTSLARTEREHRARLHQVRRLRSRGRREADRPRAVCCADAGRDAVPRIDAHGEGGPEARPRCASPSAAGRAAPSGRASSARRSRRWRYLRMKPTCSGHRPPRTITKVALVLAVFRRRARRPSALGDSRRWLIDRADRRVGRHDPGCRAPSFGFGMLLNSRRASARRTGDSTAGNRCAKCS